MSFRAYQIGQTVTHTDKGYGREYSASRKETSEFKHPKGFSFTHVHKDGHDCEDVYRYETVTFGDVEIVYSYDWGNYFIFEYVKISKDGKEVSYAERTYGAIDPLKTESRQPQDGAKILKNLADQFGLSEIKFLEECERTFKMGLPCLQLFV